MIQAQNKYMQMSIQEALYGIGCRNGGPFGAVVVDKEGRVVGRGHNK